MFNAASALPEGERPAFLDEACADDTGLREEVISLLNESGGEDSFLSRANVTAGLQLLAEDDAASLVGQEVGKYVVRGLLGHGGMGKVYLAEDLRLGRRVALKILSAHLTGDPETVLRFTQEARAASGVSHPNVAHVYEIDSAGDAHYISMEYVEGSTLRQLLGQKSLGAGEAVGIALQVANALAAAHAVGVVHRDVKPENIMVGRDHHVKVLDFGLAKLTESHRDAGARDPSSGPSVDTTPGVIMGTTAYMSPEQVRAQEVDARTDVWSLGVVLYEMLSGCQPFTGETPSDVRAAILLTEPRPLPADPPLPAGLAGVISKALSKDRILRHRTAEEFARALSRVKQEIYLGENAPPHDTASVRAQADMANAADRPFRRRSRQPVFIAAGLCAAVLAAALLYAFYGKSGVGAVAHPVARISNSGSAVRSAISADGNMIAYVLEEGGRQGLFLRHVGAVTEDELVVPPAANEFVGVSFSPNGRHLYFSYKQADDVIASLYRVPARGGGVPDKVLTDIDSAAGFSPDGGRFVFLRIAGDGSREDLCVADADGAAERVVYTRRMPEYIPHQAQPVFSPDGQSIVFPAGDYVNGEKRVRLLGLGLADGSVEQLAAGAWAEISQAAWAEGGRALIMTARLGETQEFRQLWRVARPSGAAVQLTSDFNDYAGVSVAADGVTFVTQAGTRKVSLWETVLGGAGETSRQLTFGNDDGFGVAVTPDGRIVYGSNAGGGNPDIWIMSRDGTGRHRLTGDPSTDAAPAVSPDGRLIAFTSTRGGTRHVWVMGIDGGGRRRLTDGTGESTPTFSADGKHILYFSYNAGTGSLWKVPVEGGEAVLLATGAPRFPAVSPDGRSLATAYRREGETVNKIGVVPYERPNSEPNVFNPVRGARSPGPIRWARDGRSFTYIVTRGGVSNIWQQPLDKSPARQLTNFSEGRVYAFDWTPDGLSVVCARGDALSGVVLFRLK